MSRLFAFAILTLPLLAACSQQTQDVHTPADTQPRSYMNDVNQQPRQTQIEGGNTIRY